jgi:hypothetical protein
MEGLNSIAANGVLFDGRYKLLRTLSSDGGTADVWLALDTNTIDEIYDDQDDKVTSVEETGIKVAIKIYRPKNALDLGEQRFREEFKIVFNCHHTNLVQPINFAIFEGVPYLVLPYCKNGSSESFQGKIHDTDELWRYIADVSAGLAYLHSFSPTIVHHDIKPANILIDDSNNFAITDFGISSHRGLNREGYADSQSGTMAYMAPERFKEDYESTPESDIWSFGATLYELITGEVPFGEDGGFNQLEKRLSPPVISKNIPSDLKTLISDCLSLDLAKRPAAADIYKAAQSRHYPATSPKRYIIIGAIIIAIIAALFLIFKPISQTDSTPATIKHLSNEEVFNNAITLIDSSDAAIVRKGLSILDSLASLGYVPAIYEEALTYGWYDDEKSVKRKEVLGIETQAYLPTSYHVNNKAIAYLTRIEEISDPKYPELNAQALYKLAVYYFNDNKMFKKDVDRAERLSEMALEWAKKSGNDALVQKISRNLQIIKDSKN